MKRIVKGLKIYQAVISNLGTLWVTYNQPYTLTSDTEVSDSAYDAVFTGTAGQTLELFLNGASEGNMTESPSGTYTLSVTLEEGINTLIVDDNFAVSEVTYTAP